MAHGGPAGERSASAGPLVVVLLLTLGVVGAITGVAWLSVRSHRLAAENAMRDYAEFAAASYAGEAVRAITASSSAILSPAGGGAGVMQADHVTEPALLRRAASHVRECRCVFDPAPRYVFAYVPRDGALRAAGDSLPGAGERARLADSLRASFDTPASLLPAPGGGPRFHAVADTADGDGRLYVATLVRGVHGVPDVVYGYATSFGTFARAVLPRLTGMPLVPARLTGGLPNDSLLSVRVRDAAGRIAYESAPRYDTTYSASRALWSFFPGGPRVQVAIRPAAAEALLAGGLPGSRAPLLAALLVCAGALVLVAVQLARRAQELALVRSDFTSSVSHELRTPLAQIVLFAESLAFGRVAGEGARADALRVILREARRLAHLVDNVLLFSRTERRATHVSAHPRALAPVIRDVVAGFEPLARVRHATLRTTLDERVVAPVDAGALRQILLNLLDNAVKYGPDGQTVEVGLVLDGARALLRVDDEGTGVPPSDRDRIWQPFERLRSGEYSVATGSGIGLSVVGELVALHGGSHRVDRAPGGGARFEIAFRGASARALAVAARRPGAPNMVDQPGAKEAQGDAWRAF